MARIVMRKGISIRVWPITRALDSAFSMVTMFADFNGNNSVTGDAHTFLHRLIRNRGLNDGQKTDTKYNP